MKLSSRVNTILPEMQILIYKEIHRFLLKRVLSGMIFDIKMKESKRPCFYRIFVCRYCSKYTSSMSFENCAASIGANKDHLDGSCLTCYSCNTTPEFRKNEYY